MLIDADQGESNEAAPLRYNCTFPALIDAWRAEWANATNGHTAKDFPFGETRRVSAHWAALLTPMVLWVSTLPGTSNSSCTRLSAMTSTGRWTSGCGWRGR